RNDSTVSRPLSLNVRGSSRLVLRAPPRPAGGEAVRQHHPPGPALLADRSGAALGHGAPGIRALAARRAGDLRVQCARRDMAVAPAARRAARAGAHAITPGVLPDGELLQQFSPEQY